MKKTQKGYSILEVLVVITLIAVIALTATRMLFTTLSGSGKAANLAVVKQNGDHTIGVIERTARGASSVDCGLGNTLTVTDADGNDRVFSITANRITLTTTSAVSLTSDQLIAENFSCTLVSGVVGAPDIVLVSFQLRRGVPGVDRPSDVAIERFETRVSLRTY